jgi:adenylate kinase
MQVILKEFEYQSSLELGMMKSTFIVFFVNLKNVNLIFCFFIYIDHETYDAIAHIPLATKISVHARQDLISRLEHYQETEPELFSMAIKFVNSNVIPMVQRHAISGQALVRTYVKINLILCNYQNGF